MSEFRIERLQPGDVFPEHEIGAFTKEDCERIMNTTGDHHPIHCDRDYAVAVGMPDIVVPGLLVFAHASRILTRRVSPSAIRSLAARFRSLTHPGEWLTASGSVTDRQVVAGEQLLWIDIRVADRSGGLKLSGKAVIAAGPA